MLVPEANNGTADCARAGLPGEPRPMTRAPAEAPTERLPAGAGRIGNVLFQVLKYDVLGDGAVGG